MGSLRIVPYVERPDLDDRWEETIRPVWPEFIEHDEVPNNYWQFLFERFPDFQFYLLDEETDEVIGVGNTIPFSWDGDPASLPDGVAEVLPLGVAQHDSGTVPNTLCALQAVVTLGNQGQGHSSTLVGTMVDLASIRGFASLVAPVRPNMKDQHPRMPIEEYVAWIREDGLPYDAWLRVHARLGATTVGICPGSMNVRGTVAEWREWTGMEFPSSGKYEIEGGLVPVAIDLERDLGTYVEPNVWMLHRTGG